MASKAQPMDPDASVHIERVGNGFIVRPADSWWREFGGNRDLALRDGGMPVMVFNDLSDLYRWMRGHFTHRGPGDAA